MSSCKSLIFKFAVTFTATAAMFAGAGADAQERKRTGKVEVTVEVKAGGATVPPVTLYLDNQRVELPAGTKKHLFAEVPVVRRALTGEARIGGKRYIGVQPVAVVANRTVQASLTLEEAPDVEAFCGRCHPGNPDEVGEGQILRDRHVSGKILGEKYRAPVEKYNAAVEALRKEGKPHNEPIILEKRVVTEGGKKVERLFYTCESCHTLHWARTEQKYARALFKKQGDLCRGCHP